METSIIKVTDKGQISIPRSMRQSLKIEMGDNLLITNSEGKIIIKKIVDDDFKDILKISEESLKEVWDNKEDEIWNEYLK
ncbi:MAG: AbrB/MazE/SpoVT family DNA-binding domain-containing protein [Nanoarchaeota archaeon]